MLFIHLNTSYVDIKLRCYLIVLQMLMNLNTSYVDIKLRHFDKVVVVG